MSRVMCVAPLLDTPGKKDMTGAFLPEANGFLKFLNEGGKVYRFDNRKDLPGRRKEMLGIFEQRYNEDTDPLEVFALFCHGWADGVQAGFTTKTVKSFVGPLADICSDDVKVVLYCCSTGKDPQDDPMEAPGTGDGSFADAVRDALCAAGRRECRVVAHTTAAHTTQNPYALFFEGMGSPVGGVGGIAPVTPGSKLWSTWKKQLKTDFRFEYPILEIADIHEHLLAVK